MNILKSGTSSGTPSADELARLIRQAGERPAPSASLEQSVFVAVEREWRAAAIRRKHARAWRFGLAASLVALAVGLGLESWRHGASSPPLFVGTIVDTRGAVQVTPGSGHALIAAGDVLTAGSRIETGPYGAALLTAGAVGVRVGADTVLDFERPEQIHLVRGQLYVDSGENPRPNALVLVTEFGKLTHLGTQYQVRVRPGLNLDASVREGQVRAEVYGQTQILTRGEGLRVTQDKTLTRIAVPTDDARWQWVSDFVPAFSIEGRSLSVFLDWFARETGRTLTYIFPATRATTDQTMLSGSISGLTPLQALTAVAATTRFQCDLSIPGQVRVSVGASDSVSMHRNVPQRAAAAMPSH